jgi:hypothetical protein
MDYYSALNSLSSQSQSLDYASQTLLGGVSSAESFSKLSSQVSSDFSGITADAQSSITKITGAFEAKATARESLIAGLEGGAVGIEAVKKTRESVKKYTEQEEGNAKIKADAEAKAKAVEPKGGGEVSGSADIELDTIKPTGIVGDRGTLPSVNPTETPLEPEPYTGSRLPVRGNDPTGWDAQEATRSAGVVDEGSEAVASESAVASIEGTAGEIALAGGAGLDVVADAVAGATALVGLGVGLYDLFDKSAEKKEKKEEDKAKEAEEAQQQEAQQNYDTKVSNLNTQYQDIRSNITSNTHSAVAIGVQNIRNTYKSSGTF